MKFTALELAGLLSGTIEGDKQVLVYKFSPIEQGEEGSLSFLANPKYTPYIYTTKSSIVLISNDFVAEEPLSCTLIRVKDAYVAFQKLMTLYQQANQQQTQQGVHPMAFVHEEARVDKDAHIGAFAYIGKGAQVSKGAQIYPHCYVGDESTVGEDTILYANVSLYHHCHIGNRCIIHSGVVIGSDGFGFAPDEHNEYQKIPQLGNVVIEDAVEIGANTTIDRATMGATRIRKGAKLDNLIQIAHNVEIGENTVIASQTGISGSAKIGNNCMLGGQVGIVGHISIADEVKIGAQSGIGKSITQKGTSVLGSPAIDIRLASRVVAIQPKLPDMYKQLFQLQKELNELKERIMKE